MAGEEAVGGAVLQLFDRSRLDLERGALQAAWLSAGLPAAPVDGLVGRRQIEIAIPYLERLVVELSSLGKLGALFPAGFEFRDLEDDFLGTHNPVREPTPEDEQFLEVALALGDSVAVLREWLADG